MPNRLTLAPLPIRSGNLTRTSPVFEEHAEAILAEWLNRAANPPARRAESPNAWFKREAYQLLAHYISHDMTRTFRVLAIKDGRSDRVLDEALKNPFKLGLLALINDDDVLSRSDRHVFGNQMLYGWIHDVPPDFLNAFLAVSGGPGQIASKLKSRQAEPGFEHRFMPDRLPPLVA